MAGERGHQSLDLRFSRTGPRLGIDDNQHAVGFRREANHGGKVWRTGAALGQDNEHVYRGYLGMSEVELDRHGRAAGKGLDRGSSCEEAPECPSIDSTNAPP